MLRLCPMDLPTRSSFDIVADAGTGDQSSRVAEHALGDA